MSLAKSPTPIANDRPKGFVMQLETSSGTHHNLVAIARSRLEALSITALAFDYDFTSLQEVRRIDRSNRGLLPCA